MAHRLKIISRILIIIGIILGLLVSITGIAGFNSSLQRFILQGYDATPSLKFFSFVLYLAAGIIVFIVFVIITFPLRYIAYQLTLLENIDKKLSNIDETLAAMGQSTSNNKYAYLPPKSETYQTDTMTSTDIYQPPYRKDKFS